MTIVSSDTKYHEALDQLKAHAEQYLANGRGVLFSTQVRKKLPELYRKAVRAAVERYYPEQIEEFAQYFNCSACSRFMSRVGHLVHGDKHNLVSIYWAPEVVTDPFMKEIVTFMKEQVENSQIVNIFNKSILDGMAYVEHSEGTDYRHFYVAPDLLEARVTGLGVKLQSLLSNSELFNRMSTLLRIVDEVSFKTALCLDQMFKSNALKAVGESATMVEKFIGLLVKVSDLRKSEQYSACQSEYGRKAMVHNLVWLTGASQQELTTLRSSLAGSMLIMLEEAGDSATKVEAAKTYWKKQSNGVHYRRTTAEASVSQLQSTANWLEENGYSDSIAQEVALEKEIPVLWVSKGVPEESAAPGVSAKGFGDFAAEKASRDKEINGSYSQKMDAGYFFNTVLQHVDSMSLDMTGASFSPVMYNRMANPEAKPIFMHDTEEKRCPYIAWRWENAFSIDNMFVGEKVGYRTMVPVLSVTTSVTVGSADTCERIAFMLGDVCMPIPHRPALFSTALKKEFYHHRRMLEDYGNETNLPSRKAEGQEAICLNFYKAELGQSIDSFPNLTLHVKFSEAGRTLFGHKEAIFIVPMVFAVDPDLSKFDVIPDRTKSAEPVAREEVVNTAAVAAVPVV